MGAAILRRAPGGLVVLMHAAAAAHRLAPLSNPLGPRSCLLDTCLAACDKTSELVRAIYALIPADREGAVEQKRDTSVYTLADGFVQARPLPPRSLHGPTPPTTRRMTISF